MAIVILAISGILCLGYYTAIVLYSGIGTSASIMWLLSGAAFLVMAFGGRYYLKNPDRLPLWVPVSAVTLVGSGMIVLLTVLVLIFANVPGLATPGLDYVIVLGAKVRAGELSRMLQKRLDKAAEYVAENPDSILVLSGGQGADEPCSEAEAMYGYLKAKGVPERQMLLEAAAANTLENIVFSQRVIEADRQAKKSPFRGVPVAGEKNIPKAPDKPIQIGIITNNFHLYRARLIAVKRGIESVSGVAAGSDPLLLPHLSVRECLAILKDRLVGNI